MTKCENCGHDIGGHTGPNATIYGKVGCLVEGCDCDWIWDVEEGTKPPVK